MNASQVFFLVLYCVLALIGLFMAGVAVDFPITLFGLSLVGFGLLCALGIIRRHYDALDAARHHARSA